MRAGAWAWLGRRLDPGPFFACGPGELKMAAPELGRQSRVTQARPSPPPPPPDPAGSASRATGASAVRAVRPEGGSHRRLLPLPRDRRLGTGFHCRSWRRPAGDPHPSRAIGHAQCSGPGAALSRFSPQLRAAAGGGAGTDWGAPVLPENSWAFVLPGAARFREAADACFFGENGSLRLLKENAPKSGWSIHFK